MLEELKQAQEALLNALVYVEDVLASPEQLACFKKGTVQKNVKDIRAAITTLDTLIEEIRFDEHVFALIDSLKTARDRAYWERNRLVAILSRLYPSGRSVTAIPDWDAEWHNCIYIELPTGQVSWHIHDNEMVQFASLPEYASPWDGHSTDEKYRRLLLLLLKLESKDHFPDATKMVPALDTLIAAEEAKPQAASGLIEAVDESKDDPAGDLYAKGYADGFKAKAIAVEQELLATRHPACACPLPYRVMIPEQHHESCPVVMPQPAAPASGVDTVTLSNQLATVAGQVERWLEWHKGQRDRETLTTDDDTHIIALPVTFWPTHGQFRAWVKLFRDAQDALRTPQPDLAALLAKPETLEAVASAINSFDEKPSCHPEQWQWLMGAAQAAISSLRTLAGIPQPEGGKEP